MNTLGHYLIVGELGRGGMGVVYKAKDPAFDRFVAIKAFHLPDSREQEPEMAKESLTREAKAVGRLSHPNIVNVFHILEASGGQFLVMEYLQGSSLDNCIDKLVGDSATALDYLRQAAAALDYAHGQGILHRDIKPQNLFIENTGRLKVLDFGIAKQTATTLTRGNQLTGTPSYMPPERLRGEKADGRADQFSLAVIAYQMFTGSKPFDRETLPGILSAILFEMPKPADQVNPALPPAIAVALNRGLAKAAAERYATCGDFVDALASGWTPLKTSSTAIQTTGSRSRRWLGVAASAVLLAAAGLFAGHFFHTRSPTAPQITTAGTRPLPTPPVSTKDAPKPTPSKDNSAPRVFKNSDPPAAIKQPASVGNPPTSAAKEQEATNPPTNVPVINVNPTAPSNGKTTEIPSVATNPATAAARQTEEIPSRSDTTSAALSGTEVREAGPSTPLAQGPRTGVTQWIGALAPGQTLSLLARTASLGRIVGPPVPQAPVTIVDINPEWVKVKEAPSAANGWQKLVLENRGAQVPGLTIRWKTN